MSLHPNQQAAYDVVHSGVSLTHSRDVSAVTGQTGASARAALSRLRERGLVQVSGRDPLDGGPLYHCTCHGPIS